MARKSFTTEVVAPIDMTALIDEINGFIVGHPNSFSLVEPAQLTVKKKDGSYTKMPHIGGEEFKIDRVYVGKRNQAIYVFMPVDAAPFLWMEMVESDAIKMLSGFNAYIKKAADGEYVVAMREAKKQAAVEVERGKNKDKFEQYKELGYGTW